MKLLKLKSQMKELEVGLTEKEKEKQRIEEEEERKRFSIILQFLFSSQQINIHDFL